LRQQAGASRNVWCLGIGVCAANEDSNHVVEGSSEHVSVCKQDHWRAGEPPTSGSEAEIDVQEADENERDSEQAQVVTEKYTTPRKRGSYFGNAKRRGRSRSV